ncbi:MAG: BamA/TamA family outer membrane protein [Draconibacterium sp.]|nr:BamA/TamA family outer membrane protein [Draconibacterium sp.]
MIIKVVTGRFGFLNIVAIGFAMVLFSCSPVKFVPQNEYLVNKVEIEIDNPEVDKTEAKTFIRQKENYKILGFLKFHLMMYNLSSKKKTDDWLKRIGEPPQIYSKDLTNRSEEQLLQYMNNKGYFHALLEDAVVFDDKKQKANIKFNIKSGERFIISDIHYHIEDSALNSLFLNSSEINYINQGDPFDVYLLEKHQLEIVDLFRNNGYYYFQKDDIYFLADSNLVSKQVALDLYINASRNSKKDSAKVFNPYHLNKFYFSILPGNTPVTATRDTVTTFSDTLKWDNVVVYRHKQISYPAELFDRTMLLKHGDLYRTKEVERTFTAFNRLRQFRFVDIQFREPTLSQDSSLLDCYIRLAPLSKQSTSFDIEGTNTSGNFGIAGNINYQHRNLFRGAEVFQVRFKGATERIQQTVDGVSQAFNTRELGVESKIIIPKLLGPGNFISDFERFLPKTVITLGYNYQKRPEYTRTISTLRFGYDWKSTQDLRHVWNLVDLNMVQIFEFDQDFIDDIEDLYIKSSFTDHLILAMNYSLVYNNQKPDSKKNYTYIRFNVGAAGNLLWAISEVFNRPKTTVVDTTGLGTSEFYKVLNLRFAQYIKTDIEVSHSHQFDKVNAVVGRAFLGVGIPYGNFDVLPFEKKYFTGGANGIRAWQVRALGPGSYKAPVNSYPNQSSDIKLEANVEYRFQLTNFLEGALFLDAGNIWAINEKDNREGALFKFNKFYKQIAIGTGAGLRFDLNYFILRIDTGMKVRDPAQMEDKGWIIGKRPLTGDDFVFSFAIGYPF